MGTPIWGIGPGASLALSPNGRFLMVSAGLPNSLEWMWMVDVATGTVALQTSIQLTPARDDASALLNRMAWSPTGQTFACVCASGTTASPRLWTIDMAALDEDVVVRSASGFEVIPRQISWGTDGLAVRLPELDGDWRLVPFSGASETDPDKWQKLRSVPPPGVTVVSAVGMAHSQEGGLLGWMEDGGYWIVTGDQLDSFRSVGSPPVLGSLGDSYFTVFTDWKGEPVDYEVTRIDSNGETTLTTLPPGAITFASDLVD